MTTPDFAFRSADPGDADALAEFHGASWRVHYRGALSDAYLDGPIIDERRAVWRQRLDCPRAGQVVILAERGKALVGFVCAFADDDLERGTLIDNLHVSPEAKGRGLGRALMLAVARHLCQASPRRPIYLFVIRSNHAARGFYDRMGGEPGEHGQKVEPDGSEVAVILYAWSSPAALLARAASGSPQATNGPLR